MRITKEESIAEDLIQELFYKLWQKRFALPEVEAVGAYLRRSARNKALNYLRDQSRKPNFLSEGLALTSATPNNEASAALELRELEAQVDAAVDALPERCRLVYVLARFEGMSHFEIAKALSISTKTVENQMGRAYSFLRKSLQIFLLLFLAGPP
ncbi:MAG: RNA polymerase sigma-70 factor [Lewinella sp.]|nr:RNA polymerase sigma-70 factor [Lewinella sp.]